MGLVSTAFPSEILIRGALYPQETTMETVIRRSVQSRGIMKGHSPYSTMNHGTNLVLVLGGDGDDWR